MSDPISAVSGNADRCTLSVGYSIGGYVAPWLCGDYCFSFHFQELNPLASAQCTEMGSGLGRDGIFLRSTQPYPMHHSCCALRLKDGVAGWIHQASSQLCKSSGMLSCKEHATHSAQAFHIPPPLRHRVHRQEGLHWSH